MTDIVSYVKHGQALTEEIVTWFAGLPMQVLSYVSDEAPPAEFVSSVRAIVLRGDEVLVLTNRNGRHIVPGGRCEVGESFEETLRREVLEETGLTIGDPTLLGFVAFHHLAPKPAGYDYPYPDFVWVVYVAEAGELMPHAKLAGDYEQECYFSSVAEVEALSLNRFERLFLEEVQRRRG